MRLEQSIKETVRKLIKELYEVDVPLDDILINETKKEFEGDFTIVCFPLAKSVKKSPETIAQALGKKIIDQFKEVEKFTVIKGFLNLVISDDYWVDFLYNVLEGELESQFSVKDKTILVEYSSPNTNKPQHLGHIRNNLLGYAVAEILKRCGYNVIKANLFNDKGVQIFQSMLAWMKWGDDATPESKGIKGDQMIGDYYVMYSKALQKEINRLKNEGYSEGKARQKAPLRQEVQDLVERWEKGDHEIVKLWNRLNNWVYKGFKDTYEKLGVDFDRYYYESKTYLKGKDIVKEGLDKGIFYKKENGSVWVDLTDEGLDEKVLLREDGTSVYITQDLGTAQARYDEFEMDKAIYVVGSEQDYHFSALKKVLQKLKKPYADGIYHLSYGMVHLPSGKMKSREGTVVDADDLIQEMIDTARKYTTELGKVENLKKEQAEQLYRKIGLGALKFHLLKVEPQKDIQFDPKETIDFQGHTGPFIQYTYARIQSMLRKYRSREIEQPSNPKSYTDLLTLEKNVISENYKYHKTIREAAENLAPSLIANYAYGLAKLYNQFYAEIPVLNADDDSETHFRIQLSKLTASTLQSALQLLGIEVPERM